MREFSREVAGSWRNLLQQSDSNPLFMSWAWLSAWWETWGAALSLEGIPLIVTCEDRWIGCLPLYRFERKGPLGVHSKELHIMGNAWHIAPTVRTEYVDVVAAEGKKDLVERALQDHISTLDWDIFVYRDYAGPQPSPAVYGGRKTLVQRDSCEGVRIDTSQDFREWLERLGSSTRLKAYNRRDYLAKRHDVRFVRLSDMDAGFYWLNRFHMKRWGAPCFEGKALEFHRQFLARLDDAERVYFTALTIDGQVVSVLYDVQAGDVIYNLQSGYLEEYDRKVSLGTLHLGYAIENAFNDTAVSAYDLLAGGGKNTFYKKHFDGHCITFRTGQLVRTPWLRAVYRSYMELPDWLRRPLLKIIRRQASV